MKVVAKTENRMVLVFARGEEVIGALAEFCREEVIEGATFSAIGAVQKATLAYFDLETKTYLTKDFSGPHELVSAAGNVSHRPDGSILVHVHGVLGDQEMNTYGGHIMKMTVAVTCEMVLNILPTPLQRTHDDKMNLDLF